MRYAIPLLGNRVAPRCTFADSILMVTVRRNRVFERAIVPMDGTTWADLARVLSDQRVDQMVCGGISNTTRDSIRACDVEVMENVAGESEEILEALRSGVLHAGYGLSPSGDLPVPPLGINDKTRRAFGRRRQTTGTSSSLPAEPSINCLTCNDRLCLRGERCPLADPLEIGNSSPSEEKILASAMDVAFEEDRTLCRIAELVYFCLGMDYRRIGLAFCIDLLEPAAVLSEVLRRFFDVFPVCCKVGGILLDEPGGLSHAAPGSPGSSEPADQNLTACNPSGQAAVLKSLQTDINVIVGLCVGVDCVFANESHAPVTTIFVKDKSLANNPVGAVYSHYYLKDI